MVLIEETFWLFYKTTQFSNSNNNALKKIYTCFKIYSTLCRLLDDEFHFVLQRLDTYRLRTILWNKYKNIVKVKLLWHTLSY